jgi:hypothetical protein
VDWSMYVGERIESTSRIKDEFAVILRIIRLQGISLDKAHIVR